MVMMKELINYLLDWWFTVLDILAWTWLMMFTVIVETISRWISYCYIQYE